MYVWERNIQLEVGFGGSWKGKNKIEAIATLDVQLAEQLWREFNITVLRILNDKKYFRYAKEVTL